MTLERKPPKKLGIDQKKNKNKTISTTPSLSRM